MSPARIVLAVALASLAFGVNGAAQVVGVPQMDITATGAAHAQLLEARAAALPDAFQEEISVRSSNGIVLTNTNEAKSFTFQGHVLTVPAGEGSASATAGTSILYAPSEADDAAFRAAIGAAAGGATVDYFDARASTPSVATLLQYDAVYTWTNFAYSNKEAFGNNLGSYNDMGGTVVLGVFCTFTGGNSLAGTIMTAGYCPVVSPLGNNHFNSSNYIGNGITCIYNGVASLACNFRDFLAVQGTGIVDGSYADGEICHAYRGSSGSGQGNVTYSNGTGAVQLISSGQWGAAVGNACTCGIVGSSAWTDEGYALAGVSGDPLLTGIGDLSGNTTNSLALSNAAASALSVLIVSTSMSPIPFMGGTLVPGPTISTRLVNTNSSGAWVVTYRPPVGFTGSLWAQVAITDAAAPQGVSLSNASQGLLP